MSDDLKQKLATGFWIALFTLLTGGGVKLAENHSDNHFDGHGALALNLSNKTARITLDESNNAAQFASLQAEIESLKHIKHP